MVEQFNNHMEVDISEEPVESPISIDPLYNLIICKHCEVALPFEWVVSHLKDNHEIQVTLTQVSEFLGLEEQAMTLAEAENWIKYFWVGKAIQNIPVIEKGHRCNICQYSIH